MFDAGAVEASLTLDRTPFIRSLSRARRDAARFARGRYEATVSVRGAAKTTAEIKGVDAAAERLDGQDIDLDVDKDGSAAASLGNLSGGFRTLASNIRATGTILAASSIPFGIAALGAGIPTVTALGASMAGLALNLGKAAAGFSLVAGAAGGGALAGLKIYTALIKSTVSSSREAYEALHEQRMEQLELRKQQILTTRASERFNQEIDRQIISLSKLQAAVGRRIFPLFTRELRSWGFILRDLTPYLADTAGNIAGIATGFSKWFRTADQGKVLRDVVAFISESATKGAATLAAAGQAGIMAFRPLIPLASDLQSEILGIVRQTARWTSSAQGQRRLGQIYRSLYDDARRLGGILVNVGKGLFNVFDAIDRSGVADQATRGLARLASGLERITRRGTESRGALMRFLNDTKRLMPFAGGAVMAFVREAGHIAGVLIRARQQGQRLTILQQIFRGLERSAKPLRGLIVGTFQDLGPEIARLIPEIARFFRVFAGSSGPLVTFVRTIRRALEIFNDLPGPVKRTAANLVALKLILGGLGITAVVRPLARFAANMFLVNSASRAVAGASALPAVVGSIARMGVLLGAGVGVVAFAGALYLVYRRNKLVRESVNNLVDRLKNHLKPEIKNTKDLWKDFGKGVANRIDDLGDAIVDIFDLRRKSRERKIKQFGKNAAVDFGLGLRSHARGLDKDGSPGDELGEKIGIQIGRAIKAYLLREGSKKNGIPDINPSRWVELLTPTGGGMVNQFQRYFSSVVGPAIFKEVGWGPIKKEFRDQIISVITLAGLVPYLTRQTEKHIVKPIGDAIRKAGWGGMGRDAAWGIIKGFVGVNLGFELAKKIRDALEFVRRDNEGHSPWGSTERLGRDAALGWVRGIERNAPAMAQAVKDSLRHAIGGFKGARGFEAEAAMLQKRAQDALRRGDRERAEHLIRQGHIVKEQAVVAARMRTADDPHARIALMEEQARLALMRGNERYADQLVSRMRLAKDNLVREVAHRRAGRPLDIGARSAGEGRGSSARAITASEFRAIQKENVRDMARLMQAGMKDAPNLRAFQKSLDKSMGGYFGFRAGVGVEPQ